LTLAQVVRRIMNSWTDPIDIRPHRHHPIDIIFFKFDTVKRVALLVLLQVAVCDMHLGFYAREIRFSVLCLHIERPIFPRSVLRELFSNEASENSLLCIENFLLLFKIQRESALNDRGCFCSEDIISVY